MVFYDISQSSESPSAKKSIVNASAAHIMDRFFSFIIDYFVISPFVLFLLYISFNKGFAFWKANPNAPENDAFLLILGVAYVFYFSFVQSLFIYFWKATPGQFFLKIQTEFSESESLLFLRALLRQLSFWLSFVFLGVPLLGMLTNKARRTFYDRLSDASIVTRKSEKIFFDFEIEFKYWQSLLATLVLFFSFLIFALVWKAYGKVLSHEASFAALDEQKFFCAELKNVKIEERLQMAIGLNLGGQLSDACLDKEADFILWRQRGSEKSASSSLAYYAKSLAVDDDLDKEQKYLMQACEGQDVTQYDNLNLGCKIAYSFSTDQTEKLYQNLDEKIFLTDALKYELGLALGKDADTPSNFAQLSQYNNLKNVKKYQLTEMLTQPELQNSQRQPASVSDDDSTSVMLKLIEGL